LVLDFEGGFGEGESSLNKSYWQYSIALNISDVIIHNSASSEISKNETKLFSWYDKLEEDEAPHQTFKPFLILFTQRSARDINHKELKKKFIGERIPNCISDIVSFRSPDNAKSQKLNGNEIRLDVGEMKEKILNRLEERKKSKSLSKNEFISLINYYHNSRPNFEIDQLGDLPNCKEQCIDCNVISNSFVYYVGALQEVKACQSCSQC
jgi:hypothetical protein